MGDRNGVHGVWLVGDLDGWSAADTVDGVDCRHNDTTPHGRWKGDYLYFRVSNEWAHMGSRSKVWIRVEYYDNAAGRPVLLEYDAAGQDAAARYRQAEPLVMQGSRRWLHHTWAIEDAYFGDRQNNASDFRLSSPGGNEFHINRVWILSDKTGDGPVIISPGAPPVQEERPMVLASEDMRSRRSEFRLTERGRPTAHALWQFVRTAGDESPMCLPFLEPDRAYHLWARAEIEGRWTPWTSQMFAVRRSPPAAPGVIAPVDGASLCADGFLAEWTGGPHDGCQCALESGDGTVTVFSGEGPFNHFGVAEISPDMQYRIKVRLRNSFGWGEWSRPVAFDTMAQHADLGWAHLRGYSPHPYGLVSDLSHDYRPMLDRLSGRGVNLVRVMPLIACDPQPFPRAEDGRYDLSRVSPASLDRIRDFVAYANSRGFIVQLSVLEHCSLRHGEVKDRFATSGGNNIQNMDITDVNYASFYRDPECPEMTFYRNWATALASCTKGYDVILEVMNEPFGDTPDNLEFHRSMIKILRDAGAEKVSINSWNDDCARILGPLVDYVSWHDNGFAVRTAVPAEKVLQSTDTGGWRNKSDVLDWAKRCTERGYHFEHMAMSSDGDTGETDTDWSFVNTLGAMAGEIRH